MSSNNEEVMRKAKISSQVMQDQSSLHCQIQLVFDLIDKGHFEAAREVMGPVKDKLHEFNEQLPKNLERLAYTAPVEEPAKKPAAKKAPAKDSGSTKA